MSILLPKNCHKLDKHLSCSLSCVRQRSCRPRFSLINRTSLT